MITPELQSCLDMIRTGPKRIDDIDGEFPLHQHVVDGIGLADLATVLSSLIMKKLFRHKGNQSQQIGTARAAYGSLLVAWTFLKERSTSSR